MILAEDERHVMNSDRASRRSDRDRDPRDNRSGRRGRDSDYDSGYSSRNDLAEISQIDTNAMNR